MKSKEFFLLLCRLVLLLLKAAWGGLIALSVIITLTTGFEPFWELSKRSGVIGSIGKLWTFVVQLLTDHGLGFLLLLLNCAILTYLLVDRSRAKSKHEFEKARKKRPLKRKRHKK